MGRLTAPLAAGPWGLFDYGNAIEIELFGGALASLPDIDVFAGGNTAAVMTASGRYEVLQFAEAELVAPLTYRLTKLLRGQAGTEQAMASGAAVDADFVLLDGAVTPLPMRADQIGLPLRYRIGPAQDDNAAPSFAEIVATAEGVGLMPFAPVHLKARRDAGSGDIALSWITAHALRRNGVGARRSSAERGARGVSRRNPRRRRCSAHRRNGDARLPLHARRPGGGFRRPGGDFVAQGRATQRRGGDRPEASGNGRCLRLHLWACRCSSPSRRRNTSPTTRRSPPSTRWCSLRSSTAI